MKVRPGFVSNSSSTSFIVLIRPEAGFKLTEEDYQRAAADLEEDIENLREIGEDFLAHECVEENAYQIGEIFSRYVFRHFSVNVYGEEGDIEIIEEKNFKAQVESVLKSINS